MLRGLSGGSWGGSFDGQIRELGQSDGSCATTPRMTTPGDDLTTATTWELAIAFGGHDSKAAARRKRDVMAWLAEAGFDCLAEGVVDGVDIKVGDGDLADAETAFGGTDTTPVLVFDPSRERLAAAATELRGRFGELVSTALSALANESWQQAWDGDAADTFVAGDFAVVAEAAAREMTATAVGVGVTTITIEAAEAFGDGRHATTLAALEALSLVANEPGGLGGRGPALDVGTGNGVLAIAAAHLGYAPISATEIDAVALAVAGRNAARNGIAGIVWEETATPPLRAPSGAPFALLLANILVPVLHDLMPRFAASLAEDGVLVLAGFIEKEAPPLLAAAEAVGLTLTRRVERRGWLGLVFERKDRSPVGDPRHPRT